MHQMLTVIAATATMLGSAAFSQTTSICNNIPVVYTSERVLENEGFTSNFRRLQCAADWKSAKNAIDAGVAADVPIYDLPVSFTANWDQNKVEQWKSENCSDEERSADYASTLYRSTYSVDRITAQAQLECIQSLMDRRSVSCGVTETSSSIVFEAFWRRTSGETNNPPVVTSFNSVNTECIGVDALAKGAPIVEGGINVLCNLGEAAPMFSLNTDRGSCVASGSGKDNAITLTATLKLSEPISYRANRIVVSDGFSVVTNGYPFRLQADVLELNGSSNILSFSEPKALQMTVGGTAGPVTISAKRITGEGIITVLNAGQHGGDGEQGSVGPPGAPGGPGVGRTTNWKKNCPIPFVCDIIPSGCEGGKNGGTGRPGGKDTLAFRVCLAALREMLGFRLGHKMKNDLQFFLIPL